MLVGVRGFPLRPIPSLGAMGPGPGHLGEFFSARRRRRRRRRRRPWRDQPTTNLPTNHPTYLPTYMPKMILATRFNMNHIKKKDLSAMLTAN